MTRRGQGTWGRGNLLRNCLVLVLEFYCGAANFVGRLVFVRLLLVQELVFWGEDAAGRLSYTPPCNDGCHFKREPPDSQRLKLVLYANVKLITKE
jgi:hypothetical protein